MNNLENEGGSKYQLDELRKELCEKSVREQFLKLISSMSV